MGTVRRWETDPQNEGSLTAPFFFLFFENAPELIIHSV